MHETTKHLMFVYGTLRKGQRNHDWLGNAAVVGTCTTLPRFTLVDAGGFPGVIEPGEQSIVGEVYQISTHVLYDLDELEGYPQLFDRRMIDTKFGSCWIYIYLQPHGFEPKVMSGDWLRQY